MEGHSHHQHGSEAAHQSIQNRPVLERLHYHNGGHNDMHLPTEGSDPLRAVTAYAAICSGQPSYAAFIFEDGLPLTRQRLTANLRVLLSAAGFAPEKYASHSFRIGGATTAAAAGLPDWQIQAMGRWTSDCYTCYVRIPQSTLLQASRRLAAQGRGTQ